LLQVGQGPYVGFGFRSLSLEAVRMHSDEQ